MKKSIVNSQWSIVICYLLVLTCCMVTASCSTRKVEYAFPEDAKTMKGYDELMSHLEAGKKLYKAHCTGCHGVFTKGKKDIPNFSRVQLDNYNSNFLKKDPKNHAVAQKLSKDQLGDIILFLTFIKKDKQY
ncbi:MAG: cytochrome c [Bacteroidia bacterium]